MSGTDSWFDGVQSWTVVLTETAFTPPDENGSSMTSSHSGSGVLKGGDGLYSGRVSFSETSRVVDHVTIPTVTTMSGSETWDLSLVVAGSTYRLAVDQTSASGTVPMVTVAENTGQTYRSTSFVPWGIFNVVEGSFPHSAGDISASVSGSLEEDGCEGTLTLTLIPAGAGGGGGGEPYPAAPGKPPGAKPKKPRRKPEIPDLLPLLVREEGASAAEVSKYVADCRKMGCVRCVLAWLNQWRGVRPADVPDEAWSELDRINKRDRKVDPFCCAEHQGSGRAGVALWVGAAMPLGHTGWAVEIPPEYVASYKGRATWVDGQWVTGSFASASKSPVGPGRQEIVCPPSPQEQFRSQGYCNWKALRASPAHYEAALVAAAGFSGVWYSLVAQNCIDSTWAVLRAFGIYLGPSPNVGIVPYIWYYELDGTDTILRKISSREQAQLAGLRQDEGQAGVEGGTKHTQTRIDAVYQADAGGALHLSRDCPALARAGSSVRTFPLALFRSPEAVEAEFNGSVCGSCVTRLRAESNILHTVRCTGDQVAHIYPDCIALHTPPTLWTGIAGLTEVPLADVTGRHRGYKLPFVSGLPLVIEYDLDLPDGGTVGAKLELKFETEEDRADFEEALDQAMEMIG